MHVAKLVTVEQSVLLKKLGTLSPGDRAKAGKNVQALFGLASPKRDGP